MSCLTTGCNADTKYFVGDVGTVLLVNVCTDITAATLAALDISKPDGTTVRWVGSVYNTTYISYVVQSGDFDQTGEYRVQSYVELPSWTGHGDLDRFKVRSLY